MVLLVTSLALATPTVTVTGTCPGPVDIAVTDLTPGGALALAASHALGDTAIPSGRCAGVDTGLTGPMLTFGPLPDHDGDGAIAMSPTLPPGACDRQLVAIDLDACEVSAPAAIASGPCAQPAPTLYVATDGDDGDDGTTRDSAFATVAHALSVAGPGDVVGVLPGTHPLTAGITVPEGVTLRSTDGPAATVLDGDAQVCGYYCDTALVTMSTDSRLSGFWFSSAPNYYGIFSGGGTGVVIDTNVVDTGSHSGIRLDGGGEVQILHNTIVNNTWGGITYTSSAGAATVQNNIIAFHPRAAIDNDNWSDPWDIDWNVLYNPIAEYGETRVDNGVGLYNQMTVDPQFVDADAHDFHLLADSPAIDAGDPDYGWVLAGDCESPDVGALPYE